MDLVWETPPEAALNRTRNGPYSEIIAALKANKGQWARIPRDWKTADSAAGSAANMRRGIGSWGPKGSFEAVSEGKSVWARYVGEPDAGSDPEEKTPSRSDSEGDDSKAVAKKIRGWAREQGLEVADHGRMPKEIMDAYYDAHPDEPKPGTLRVV